MLPFAAVCGVAFLILGFATGTPGQPPLQALTFGGMYLISTAFGKLWRVHGIGAATVISLMASFSLGYAVWTAVERFISAEPLIRPLIGQIMGFCLATIYLVCGTKHLLGLMKASRSPRN